VDIDDNARKITRVREQLMNSQFAKTAQLCLSRPSSFSQCLPNNLRSSPGMHFFVYLDSRRSSAS
jgi:hypothetical protein